MRTALIIGFIFLIQTLTVSSCAWNCTETNSFWDDVSCWGCGHLPTDNDAVTISNTLNITVTIRTNVTVGSIDLTGNTTLELSQGINETASLTVRGDLAVGADSVLSTVYTPFVLRGNGTTTSTLNVLGTVLGFGNVDRFTIKVATNAKARPTTGDHFGKNTLTEIYGKITFEDVDVIADGEWTNAGEMLFLGRVNLYSNETTVLRSNKTLEVTPSSSVTTYRPFSFAKSSVISLQTSSSFEFQKNGTVFAGDVQLSESSALIFSENVSSVWAAVRVSGPGSISANSHTIQLEGMVTAPNATFSSSNTVFTVSNGASLMFSSVNMLNVDIYEGRNLSSRETVVFSGDQFVTLESVFVGISMKFQSNKNILLNSDFETANTKEVDFDGPVTFGSAFKGVGNGNLDLTGSTLSLYQTFNAGSLNLKLPSLQFTLNTSSTAPLISTTGSVSFQELAVVDVDMNTAPTVANFTLVIVTSSNLRETPVLDTAGTFSCLMTSLRLQNNVLFLDVGNPSTPDALNVTVHGLDNPLSTNFELQWKNPENLCGLSLVSTTIVNTVSGANQTLSSTVDHVIVPKQLGSEECPLYKYVITQQYIWTATGETYQGGARDLQFQDVDGAVERYRPAETNLFTSYASNNLTVTWNFTENSPDFPCNTRASSLLFSATDQNGKTEEFKALYNEHEAHVQVNECTAWRVEYNIVFASNGSDFTSGKSAGNMTVFAVDRPSLGKIEVVDEAQRMTFLWPQAECHCQAQLTKSNYAVTIKLDGNTRVENIESPHIMVARAENHLVSIDVVLECHYNDTVMKSEPQSFIEQGEDEDSKKTLVVLVFFSILVGLGLLGLIYFLIHFFVSRRSTEEEDHLINH